MLLFRDRQYEDGVQMRTYIAKPLDSRSALSNTGAPQHRLVHTDVSGTRKWGGVDIFSVAVM